MRQVEVVRGPASVLYGSDALGGVVNVITRPAGERWRFGALGEASHAEGGRGGSGHRLALSAAGPLGVARLAACTSFCHNEGIARPA